MRQNIVNVTPFMHVQDLSAALAFMTDILGFEIDLEQTGYAYVSREGAGLRILEDASRPPELNSGFAYYYDVFDVDALYEELKPKLDRLPEGYVHGPVDQPYSQRELVVRAPDGRGIVFGQGIGPNARQWDFRRR